MAQHSQARVWSGCAPVSLGAVFAITGGGRFYVQPTGQSAELRIKIW